MPATDARARMISSAVQLLQERGAAGVTIDAVLADSGAPRGSVYHHFPQGRRQLLQEAAQFAADHIAQRLQDAGDDPAQLVDSLIRMWTRRLRETDYQAGCPLVGLISDRRPGSSESHALAGEAFTQWTTGLSRALRGNGWSPAQADAQATLVIAAIEGALLMSQAQRDLRPLEQVGARLRSAVRAPDMHP
ncbi:TetR/AcrR family transcriptional regulator [Dermacoccaceae bacterium W4C1]